MAPAWDPSLLPDLTGKIFVVTGGNTGIGYITIQHLLSRNARVWLGARDATKAQAAIRSLRETNPKGEVEHLLLDHMDLASVARAAEQVLEREKSLNGIINNAGIMATPYALSKDGYEAQWQTNYISHWLLTYKLLPLLQATAKRQGAGSARVVCVTSVGHKFYRQKKIDYGAINSQDSTPYQRYGLSKLGNILHAKQIAATYGPSSALGETGGEVWAATCHPGNYDTQLTQGGGTLVTIAKPLLKLFGIIDTNMDNGSHSSLFIGASQEFKREMCGEYFVPIAKLARPSAIAQDANEATQLWSWTEKELRSRSLI
ncbi:NAD(P)-binding protein [Paraphaeosphaeria sporulosa]|uniref:NAD(P)-binding protein n=1 Tax=Paraphaeosphaeria sporulosa TaxID=1460663 RepID=A0A177CNI6_9PLEO|nr:NAD(P)-binding protein [Paraphaeosphaeria sporulosa]OAG08317.1 NAD(P)-binding protein [Paraphaeosphaeria sporulosa]